MQRSTVESWLEGPSDLKEEVVEDVPRPGESVKIRALPASFSAKLLERLQVRQDGRQEVGELPMTEVQVHQFLEGVIEPKFTEEQVRQLADKYGPSYHKIMGRINAISGVDEEAAEETQTRFPDRGTEPVDNGRRELGAVVEGSSGVGS